MVVTDPLTSDSCRNPDSQASTPVQGMHEIVLVKADHRYVLRCARGQESRLLTELANLVRDPDMNFSWLDAAVISQALRRHLAETGTG